MNNILHGNRAKSATLGDYSLAAISGGLIALTYPDFGVWPLAWVAPALLILIIRGKTLISATGLGFVAGLFYFGPTLYWISNTMTEFAHMPIWLAAPANGLLITAAALYPAMFAHFVVRVDRRFGWDIALAMAPFIWVAVEFLRSIQLDFAFPWARLADSQYIVPHIIQVADIFGEEGLTYIILFANVALAKTIGWYITRRSTGQMFPYQWVAMALMMITLTLAYGEYRLNEYNFAVGVKKMKVGVAQGNTDQARKWHRDYLDEQLYIYVRLTMEAAGEGAELIVWPETAATFHFGQNPTYDKALRRLVKGANTPVLFGAPRMIKENNENVSFNTAWLVRPDGVEEKFDKVHLVPFGEYVPLKPLLFFVNALSFSFGNMRSGDKIEVLHMANEKVGVQICYEIIFPKYSRELAKLGAGLIANITNDSWYGVSPASNQSIAMGVFRAVENRIPVVRSAQTGVSALIEATGEIKRRTRLFEEALIVDEITLKRDGLTIYTITGDLFNWLCALISIGVVGVSFRRQKQW